MLYDSMEVTVLLVEHLMHQVNELDPGITTEFAEGGGAFHALVSEAVQTSEKISGADFSHREGGVECEVFAGGNIRSFPPRLGRHHEPENHQDHA